MDEANGEIFSKLEEEKTVETLQDLINQVGNFFLAETNKMN